MSIQALRKKTRQERETEMSKISADEANELKERFENV
jgi:hypothetical protein